MHKWLLRHVYFPAVRAGLSRFWAVIATFFVSAVFHEVGEEALLMQNRRGCNN